MDVVLKLLPNDVPGMKLKHEIVDKNNLDSLQRWLTTRGPRRTGAKREIVGSKVKLNALAALSTLCRLDRVVNLSSLLYLATR
jgi:hypothetical protein